MEFALLSEKQIFDIIGSNLLSSDLQNNSRNRTPQLRPIFVLLPFPFLVLSRILKNPKERRKLEDFGPKEEVGECGSYIYM